MGGEGGGEKDGSSFHLKLGEGWTTTQGAGVIINIEPHIPYIPGDHIPYKLQMYCILTHTHTNKIVKKSQGIFLHGNGVTLNTHIPGENGGSRSLQGGRGNAHSQQKLVNSLLLTRKLLLNHLQ